MLDISKSILEGNVPSKGNVKEVTRISSKGFTGDVTLKLQWIVMVGRQRRHLDH